MAETVFTLAIQGPEGFKLDFTVPVGITRIGRQAGNDIVLVHGQISRSHARLETTGSDCAITDLESSNGTAVNGEKIPPNSPTSIKDGDQVKIGPFEIAVSAVEKKEEQAAAADTPPAADASIVEEVKPAEPEEDVSEQEKPPKPEKEEPPAKKKAPQASEKKPASKPKAKKAAPPKAKPVKKEEPARPPAGGPPPADQPPGAAAHRNGSAPLPPGLSYHSTRLLEYLPGIYHTDFMARFLGIFEATLLPIEWTMDNFDLFLDPDSSPADFLSWLGGWYGLTFDSTWTEVQRRTLLKEAHAIFARRGTASALSRVLEIYTGVTPEIDDQDSKLDPFTFKVTIPLRKRDLREDLLEALIDAHKPAHTNYTLAFKGS